MKPKPFFSSGPFEFDGPMEELFYNGFNPERYDRDGGHLQNGLDRPVNELSVLADFARRDAASEAPLENTQEVLALVRERSLWLHVSAVAVGVAIVALLGLSACTGEGAAEGQACDPQVIGSCDGPWECLPAPYGGQQGHTCQKAECYRSDLDCEVGERCIDLKCVAVEKQAGECRTSTECGSGRVCLDQRCQDRDTAFAGIPCKTDSDCARHHRCMTQEQVRGDSLLGMPQSFSGRRCYPKRCFYNEQCPHPQFCADGHCVTSSCVCP